MPAGDRLENENPVIFQRTGDRLLTASDEDEDVHDPIDDREIFDILFLISLAVPPMQLIMFLLKSVSTDTMVCRIMSFTAFRVVASVS